MGQKTHPLGLRLGYVKSWKSSWFSKAKRGFGDLLHEDIKIRKHIKDNFLQADISKVEIERAGNRARINIYTARPGVIIGRRGADIDRLRDELQEITGKEVYIDIKEIKDPALEAQLVADNIAFQLEKRISHRRAMKKTIATAIEAGAEGIKISCAGRLGGAEMSRREGYHEGKVPLQTLRADVDYGFREASTAYGIVGVKVWIYKGEILPQAGDSTTESTKE